MRISFDGALDLHKYGIYVIVCVYLQIINQNKSAIFTFYSECYKHFTHSYGAHKTIWKTANYMMTEYSDILGHDAVLFGVCFPVFQMNAVPSP